MKSSLLMCLTVLGLAGSNLTSALHAQPGGYPDRRFGAGIILGEPTGVSLKYWIDARSAVDGVVGRSFESSRDNLYLHANYLYHAFDNVAIGRDRFAAYFGGGVRYQLMRQRSNRFGIRGVAGVTYLFDDIPVDVFLEAGPILDLTPDTKLRFSAGIGARYWF